MSVFRRQGRLFIQDDQDDPFWLLTCAGAGDVSMPAADETAVYCPDPRALGDFIIDGTVEGEAGFVTYSMQRPLQSTLNYLITDLHRCRFHAMVEWGDDGAVPDVWTSYNVALMLFNGRVSSRTVSNPVALSAADDERVETSADINAYDAWLYYPMDATRITLTEDSAINGIDFILDQSCNTDEIGGALAGKTGYFGTDHPSASAAVGGDVWYSEDYGSTWTLIPNDPFAGGEDVGPVVCRGDRVIVGRFDTDAGNPAEVAISDDKATWSNVDVGATNGQTIQALWWEDWTHLWAAVSAGYVYFSDDGGQTWAAQTSGTLTAQTLNDVCGYRTVGGAYYVWAVGAAGAIIAATDGVTWAAITGPAGVADAFNAVFLLNQNRVLIGSDAGNVYRTSDGGDNWTAALTSPQWSSGSVQAIRGELAHRYTIFIAGNTSGTVGEVYRSRDGAASFQEITDVPTNSGLNDLAVIDHNTAFAAGEPHTGTAFLVKMSAAGT